VSPLGAPPVALPLADADAGRIDALRRASGGPQSPAARQAAARELQVIFLTQLLRALRATVPENDFLPRSPARDVYEGMFDRSVAEAMAASDPLGMVARMAPPPGLKVEPEPADTVTGSKDPGRGKRNP
jgi:Rod binding domain-containing protein